MNKKLKAIIVLICFLPIISYADIPTPQWEGCKFYEKPVYCEIDRTVGYDGCAEYSNNPKYRYITNSQGYFPNGYDKYEREYCMRTEDSIDSYGIFATGAGILIIAAVSFLFLLGLKNKKSQKSIEINN